jgi:hypothetical protein
LKKADDARAALLEIGLTRAEKYMLKEFKINSISDLLKKLPTVCEPEKTVWYRGHREPGQEMTFLGR